MPSILGSAAAGQDVAGGGVKVLGAVTLSYPVCVVVQPWNRAVESAIDGSSVRMLT